MVTVVREGLSDPLAAGAKTAAAGSTVAVTDRLGGHSLRQSAVPHVLATLDRVHSPGRPQQAVAEAKAAGFLSTSLDLIYGTPGESLADWATSLDAALAAEPDHVSAYALIVEAGTRLAVQVRRGEVAMTDDDDLADKYLLAE